MREIKFIRVNGFYEKRCPYNMMVEDVLINSPGDVKQYFIKTVHSLNCVTCMHNHGKVAGRTQIKKDNILTGYILCDRDEDKKEVKYSKLTFKFLLIEKKNSKM